VEKLPRLNPFVEKINKGLKSIRRSERKEKSNELKDEGDDLSGTSCAIFVCNLR
jgi:hypothetical protein